MIHMTTFGAGDQPILMAQAWRLRHRVFCDCMGWEIPATDLLEYDDLDDRAVHGAALENGRVVGYWRALRTDGPYLLEQHFARLFQNGDLPKSERIWEISRFAIAPGHLEKRHIGTALCYSIIAHAHRTDAEAVIAVTEPYLERFIRSCGIDLTRTTGPTVVGRARKRVVKAITIRVPIHQANLQVAGLQTEAAA